MNWIDGGKDGCKDVKMCGSMDGQMNVRMCGWIDGWMNGWMNGWMHWMGECKDVWMDRQMDRCDMNEWMNTHVLTLTITNISTIYQKIIKKNLSEKQNYNNRII